MIEDTNQTPAEDSEDVEGHGVATRRVSLEDDDAAARAARVVSIAQITSVVDDGDDVQGHRAL